LTQFSNQQLQSPTTYGLTQSQPDALEVGKHRPDALKHDLTACLPIGRELRLLRARTRARSTAFITPELLISERPAEVEDAP